MWIFLDIVYFSPHNCYLLAVMWRFCVYSQVRIRARAKGVKDGTDIYERKTDQTVGIIDGAANGNIHDGQFAV